MLRRPQELGERRRPRSVAGRLVSPLGDSTAGPCSRGRLRSLACCHVTADCITRNKRSDPPQERFRGAMGVAGGSCLLA